MESGRIPAVVSAEVDGCRYVAEVSLANLQARSLVRSMNNALELVDIHSEMLDRLRKIEGDPTMIFFPMGSKIIERRESLANEIQAIRVIFGTFFSRVWKDEV
jgi:hypothetical protein